MGQMTVYELIEILQTMPQHYSITIDCGALSDAKSISRNDALGEVSISKDEEE
jgi:hypothetical protein